MKSRLLVIGALLAACGTEGEGGKAPVVHETIPLDVNESKADTANRPTMQGELAFGALVEGALTRQRAFHGYTFRAGAGERVTLELVGEGGADPYLLVYGRGARDRWVHLASNDDCHARTLDACLGVALPAAGEYLVVATTYQAVALKRHTAARYLLELGCGDADGACGIEQACGSRGLPECPAGTYCDWPDDQCGADDRPGVCRAVPEVCALGGDPVCSCTGEIFQNPCLAARAGVDVSGLGGCERPGQGEGETCGGIATLPCADGLVCDYSHNRGCFPDMGGVCARDDGPGLCPMVYRPVCGCDGVTYSNACVAAGARVATAHDGECRGRLVAGEGETCGGIAAIQCEDGLVCNYADQDYSDNGGYCPADIGGTCIAPYAVRCANIDAPVCGCDGTTYYNDCMRIGAYMAKAHDGACRR